MFRKDNETVVVEKEERTITIPTDDGDLTIPYDELPKEKQKTLDFLEMRRVEITELARNLRLGVIDIEKYDNERRIIVNSIEKEATAWE